MNIFERRQAFLQDLVDFYETDPSRRSVDGYQYLYQKGDKRCAIGRHITNYTPEMENHSVDEILCDFPDCLPKSIQELGVDFLIECQYLHDSISSWGETGLSSTGKGEIVRIEQDFLNDLKIRVDLSENCGSIENDPSNR